MFINVVIMGKPQQRVEIPTGGSVLDAIKAAGLDPNRVTEVKSNGSVLSLGNALTDNTSILVATGKVQGGNTGTTPTDFVNVRVKIEEREPEEIQSNELIAYPAGDVLSLAQAQGIDLNRFSHVEDADGNRLPHSEQLVDGQSYTIVVKA